MAKLDARMDDFIRLVLDVSGRVRASDIQGVDPSEAAELLTQYRSEHPERRLVLNGDTLMPDVSAPSGASPSVAAYGAPVTQQAPQQNQWAEVPQAQPAYPDASGNYGVPSQQPPASGAAYGGTGYDAAAGQQGVAPGTAYEAPSPYGGPEPVSQPPYAAAPGNVPAHAPAAGSGVPYPGQPQYAEQVPPASDWQGSAEPFADEQPAPVSESKVAWYWWLLPILFTWLGGLIAWLALRDRQPRAAKRLLILGLVMTVVMIALSALLIALGFAAFLTPVATETVIETSLTTATPTP